MIGKLLLPASVAERMAAAKKKQTTKLPPKKQNSIKTDVGKASTTLAEAVAATVPAASHVEPRAARKAVRLNTKTKTEGSTTKKTSVVKVAQWRAARKAAQEAAAAARAGRKALRQQQRQQASESKAVSSGGPPLAADSFVNAVALPLRPGASRTEYFEFQCKPLRQFQTWFRQKALPSQKFMHCAEDMRRALRFPWPMSVPEVRVWLFALVGYWRLAPYGRDALGYELLCTIRIGIGSALASNSRQAGLGLECPAYSGKVMA